MSDRQTAPIWRKTLLNEEEEEEAETNILYRGIAIIWFDISKKEKK